MLVQHGKVSVYVSRQLKEYEKKLPYPQPGVDRCNVRAENLATLSVWRKNSKFYRPQEFKIFLHLERVKYEAEMVA